MKLITFQPLKVLDTVNKCGVYEPENDARLGKRIFCIKEDENAMENVFISAPSMPQVLIEIEVDDSDVEVIDYLEWVNYLNGHRKYTGKYADRVKYKEYAITSIKSNNILRTIIISDSSDPDKVQDKFIETHYEFLEKLSGYQWRRSGDAYVKRFWQLPEAYELVEKITHCMMPLTPLTDDELEEAHQLIRKTFIER